MKRSLRIVAGLAIAALIFVLGMTYQGYRHQNPEKDPCAGAYEIQYYATAISLGASMRTLDLLKRKEYSRAEKMHREFVDIQYDRLRPYYSDSKTSKELSKEIGEINARATAFRQGKTTVDHIPVDNKVPIENPLTGLLESKSVRLRDFQSHLSEYGYTPWFGYDDFVSYITFSGNVFGPRVILFFYESKLYAVIHSEDLKVRHFRSSGRLGGHKIGYLFEEQFELQNRFNSHYGPILERAD